MNASDEPLAEPQDDLIRKLREDLQARDEFLSVAAHELRNPLTPISMQVDMLLRSARAASPPLPPDIVAGLERLELATRRFLNRATVLLDVSRLAAGHPFRPDVSCFDLSTLALQLVADRAPMAERLRIKLDTDAVELGIVGAWDRVGVELILDNLVSNAMKYGAGAPIALGLSRQDNNTTGARGDCPEIGGMTTRAVRPAGYIAGWGSRMGWVVRLIGTGIDGQSRSSDVMEISRPWSWRYRQPGIEAGRSEAVAGASSAGCRCWASRQLRDATARLPILWREDWRPHRIATLFGEARVEFPGFCADCGRTGRASGCLGCLGRQAGGALIWPDETTAEVSRFGR
jgi:hypothetical protein